MQITLQPFDNSFRLSQATTYLTRILETPALSGVELPSSIKGYIYIDNAPHMIASGTWEITGDVIYLARTTSRIEPLTRIAVLSVIANMTGAIASPAIVEKLSARLVQAMSETVRSIYGSIISSSVKPSRLAIDQVNLRIACEVNGQWTLANGVPTEVDIASWIIMDF